MVTFSADRFCFSLTLTHRLIASPLFFYIGCSSDVAEGVTLLLKSGDYEECVNRMEADQLIINSGDGEKAELSGYRRSPVKQVFFHAVSVLLVGTPYLVGHWYPQWKVRWTMSKSTLTSADTILVNDEDGEVSAAKVERVDVSQHQHFPEEYKITYSDDPLQESPRMRLLPNIRPQMRYFIYKRQRYVWSIEAALFERLDGLNEKNKAITKLLRRRDGGVSDSVRRNLQELHGKNSIEIEVKSYLVLLLDEVINPFYLFQIGSIILWGFDNYLLYASCILFLSVCSLGFSVYEIRKQSEKLHDMVTSGGDEKVSVMCGRGQLGDCPREVELDCLDLVPGDTISIPADGCTMTCDAVLVTGTCIVNEAMLTGESVPVTKSALEHPPSGEEGAKYEPEANKMNTLFSGTSVIQTRFHSNSKVLAVVVRTGFDTSKGELVRSILYPKPLGFKFYQDSIKFILFLSAVAVIGMTYCLYVYVSRGSDWTMTLKRCLDIITVVVPPALPAAMTIGIFYGQKRLRKNKIFCLQPNRINVAGKLKLVCFDKTGTLTEDGLDMHSVIATATNVEEELEFGPPREDVTELDNSSVLVTCLATCHSITLIDNELVGDPLDVKMFESTGWEFEEPGPAKDENKFDQLMHAVVRSGEVEVGIIRQLQFDSKLKRMSVITRDKSDNHFTAFTKGAPEELKELCQPETVPANFHEILRDYAQQGFRVIGLAYKPMLAETKWHKVQKMKRDAIEKELCFLGLLIMQNKLKPETAPVIAELREAAIRCVMVTGDNLQTAISVARDCRMVDESARVLVVESENGATSYAEPVHPEGGSDVIHAVANGNSAGSVAVTVEPSPPDYHFAMTGATWSDIRLHRPELLPSILVSGTIFARMTPDQKTQLVEQLQSIDYVVGMCGDGANDCGALKAANVGISISEAEASVAAPFTSGRPGITCVPDVIREGRCSLVSSFATFKYMAMYSIIQFVSVLILYTHFTNLGDTMYLYIDLVILGAITFFMAWTEPCPKLVEKRPPGSLVSFSNLFCLGAQMCLVVLLQAGAILFLKSQSWYIPNSIDNPDEEVIVCWETTVIFIVSAFQYLAVALAFSRGKPFRKPFHTNVAFTISMVILTGLTTTLLFLPKNPFSHFIQLVEGQWQPQFRGMLMVFPLAHLLAAVSIEAFVSESKILKVVSKKVVGKTQPKNLHKRILMDLKNDERWPPEPRTRHERGFS